MMEQMNVDVNREVKLNAERIYPLFLIKNLKKSMKDFYVCDVCVLQCHSAGVPRGAAEELSGHAGANAGREGLPGDRVPA